MDEFLAEQGITKLDILKIDAEGNDMQVIRGAGKALNTTVGVFTFEGNNDGRNCFHALIHSLTHARSLTHSLTHSRTHTCFLTHFLPQSLTHSLIPSLSLVCIYSPILLLLYCFIVFEGNGVMFDKATIDGLDAQGYSCYSTSRAGGWMGWGWEGGGGVGGVMDGWME